MDTIIFVSDLIEYAFVGVSLSDAKVMGGSKTCPLYGSVTLYANDVFCNVCVEMEKTRMHLLLVFILIKISSKYIFPHLTNL